MLTLKKSLGQNFLIDKNIINKILHLTKIKNKNILEIGPGTGNLTKFILEKKPKKLLLIEKDKRLCNILNSKLDNFNNYKILNEDILKFDLNSNFKSEIIFGNLPYNISTQILVKLIKFDYLDSKVEKIIFMFQKEVADRILAKPKAKQYGRLTILANYRLDIVKSFSISKNSFFPIPSVDSKVIVFKPKLNIRYKINNIKNLEYITNIFFGSKRKMINKAFARIFKNHLIVCEKLKINLKLRPSDLSLDQYYKLAEYYESNK